MKIRIQPLRRLYVLCALILVLVSVWELIIRMDAMYGPLMMFFEMAWGERIPLATVMTYFDFSILAAPFYLIGCVLLGIIALIFSRRPLSALFVLPASLVLGILGFEIGAIPLLEGWRMIRLIPLGGLSLGGIMKLILHPRKKKLAAAEPARLADAPRLRALSNKDDRRSA